MGLSAAAVPAIEAVGSIGSSVASGLFGYNQAAKNRSFQERMYYQQLEDNRRNWEEVNRYNSPSAQVARMRLANLNPLLAYGGDIQNITTPHQPASAPSGAQANMSFANPFTGFSVNQAMMQKLQAEIEKLQAEKDKTVSETNFTDLQTKWNRESYNIRLMIQYGEYDRVRAVCRDLSDQILQRGFMNTQQAISLAQARIYEIKRFDLDQKATLTGLDQRWREIANGTIAANAQLKNACANWLNASTNLKEANWRIGAMAQDIYFKAQSQPYMLKNMSLQNELNRYDIRIKANDITKGFYENQLMYNTQGANQIPLWMAPFFIYSNMKDKTPVIKQY